MVWTLITIQIQFSIHKIMTGPGPIRSSTELSSSWQSFLVNFMHITPMCTIFFFWPYLTYYILNHNLIPDLDPSLDLHTILKWFFWLHLSHVFLNAGQFLLPHLVAPSTIITVLVIIFAILILSNSVYMLTKTWVHYSQTSVSAEA